MTKKNKTQEQVYTYRNGKKIYLEKEPDQFVVRAKPEELEKIGITRNVEKVSPGSSRITVKQGELESAMDEMRKEVVTHHAYKQENSNSEFLITDRIMVTFKKPISNEELSQFMAKYALALRNKYSDKEYLFQLTDHTNMNPVKLVVLINETEKEVESCEHDLNKRMMKVNVNIPADTKYMQQWHLHTRLNNSAFDPRSSANCESAWNLLGHYGSNDVVIAVTDDGCKLDHADFDSGNKFAHWAYMQGSNLINRDSVSANPANMYQAGSDHGTCCCGVIGAEIDGSLTVGAASGCRLLPVKWESDADSLHISDSKMMTVLAFIADKADVVSNSWGSSPEFNFASNVINRITTLAQTGGRRGKGVVFLWAAGNENCPIQYSGTKNIPYDNGYDRFGNWRGVQKSKLFEHNLTTVPGVMHIAALASNAQRSHYSNYGDGISLCAPSSNSHEYWRMAVTGLGILTTSGHSPFFDSDFGGTSSATPLVAGIIGLVISAYPNLSSIQIVSILQKTASKDLNMTKYARTPAANYDPDTSWDVSPIAPHDSGDFKNIGHADGTWSGWFGFGKVDAEAAVEEALRLAGGSGISENVISQSSAPSKLIPDNNTTGITDVITVAEQGTITSLKIDVNVTHNYIGDLVIKLTSPKGTVVTLHNRNGANTKNINKTFDLQNTASISLFNGESITGNWILSIVDAASQDTGRLDNWGLHIGISKQSEEFSEDIAGMVIPDNNPAGIERMMNINSSGVVNNVEVKVDITHTYISDLIVNLVSPKGTIISLHSRSGNSADNIIKTYNFSNTLSLQSLVNEQIQGNWKLKVSDVVGQDIGKLNKWSLKIVKA